MENKNIGIDEIGVYIPQTYLPLASLAAARGVDPAKFATGLGQAEMAVCPPDEDVVTMAVNAADKISKESLSQVSWVLFATESGIDQSKISWIIYT